MTNPIRTQKIFYIILKLTLFFFLLGLVSFGVYLFWENQRIESQINFLNTSSYQLTQQVNQQNALIKTHQITLGYLLGLFNQHQDSWSLAETESIVNMAHLTLQLQKDIPTTLKLLHIAQKNINNLKDSRAVGVSYLIQQSISALQSFHITQIESIFAKLQMIDNQVDQLPFIADRSAGAFVGNEKEMKHQATPSWQQALQSSWEGIKQFLVIKKNDVSPSLVLSQQTQLILRLSLHLYLAQAESALLEKHPEIYQQSLKNVECIIKQYFAGSDEQVSRFLQNIEELKQIDIAPQFPKLDQLFSELKNTLRAYQMNMRVTIINSERKI